jgi:hypothetical protein
MKYQNVIASIIIAAAIIAAAYIMRPPSYVIAPQGGRAALFRMNARTGAMQYCFYATGCVAVP